MKDSASPFRYYQVIVFADAAREAYLFAAMKYRVKHLCEYAALRAVFCVVHILPEWAAVGLGMGLARVARLCMRSRVREAERRVREVLGASRSDKDVRQIVATSLQTLVLNGIEMMRMRRMNENWCRDHILNPEVIQPLQEHLQSGRGAILAACHMGHWHLAAVAMNYFDVSTFFLIAHQRNPLTNRFMNQMLAAGGGEGICRDTGSMRTIIRNLRNGKVLAITPDVRSKTPAVAVDFLGGTANIPEGMALFARQTNSPIFPCSTVRESLTTHRWTLHPPIYPDSTMEKSADIQRMTQAVMQVVDTDIRAHPEQYFWFNKRWILEPLTLESTDNLGIRYPWVTAPDAEVRPTTGDLYRPGLCPRRSFAKN